MWGKMGGKVLKVFTMKRFSALSVARQFFIVGIIAGLAFGFFLIAVVKAEPIMGQATVIDGDDLRFDDGLRVRLCGIDAPELGRPGGKQAASHLKVLAKDQNIFCTPVGEGTPCDDFSKATHGKRIIATCRINDRDLATEMVKAGHARDWPKYSGGFYAAE